MYNTEMDVKRVLLIQHYEECYDQMVARARRHVGDFWAEDVVQTAFERGLRYLHTLPLDMMQVYPYMSSILNNTIRDFSNQSLSKTEVTEDMIESTELQDDEEHRNFLNALTKKIVEEPMENRTILYMFFIRGETEGTVSKILNVSIPKVRHIYQRFRAKIQKETSL